MPRVELAGAAVADLERMIRTYALPSDTKRRVRRCLVPLRHFPGVGPELTGRWRTFRFLFGPWRWMLLIYIVLPDEDRVVVVTVQDARSSTSATASARSGEVEERRGRYRGAGPQSDAARPAGRAQEIARERRRRSIGKLLEASRSTGRVDDEFVSDLRRIRRTQGRPTNR